LGLEFDGVPKIVNAALKAKTKAKAIGHHHHHHRQYSSDYGMTECRPHAEKEQ